MGAAQKRILRNSVIIGVLLTIGSYPLFWRWDITVAVLLGAAAMVVNFWLLNLVIQSFVKPDSGIPKWKVIVRLVLKIGFLFGVLFLLMYGPKLDPLALVTGVSSVVLAIFLEGVLPAVKEEDAADRSAPR